MIDDGTLSVNNTIESQFKIYPNPVKYILNVKTTSNNYSVGIYNIQGQLINRIKNVSGIQTVDYSNYTTGIYFMKIVSETASKTFKIVKK